MSTAMQDEGFVAKWRARWPEWRVGLGFVSADERARAEAWFALLDEFAEAAWSGRDATPGLAKLAWWQEELQGWAKGARRHPLAAVLQRVDAPWQSLALALPTLPSTREAAQDLEGVRAHLQALTSVIDACETRLFASGQGATRASSAGQGLVAARAVTLADADLARACLATWPGIPGGTRPRRIADAILAGRLRLLARGGAPRPLGGPALVWRLWRAARAN